MQCLARYTHVIIQDGHLRGCNSTYRGYIPTFLFNKAIYRVITITSFTSSRGPPILYSLDSMYVVTAKYRAPCKTQVPMKNEGFKPPIYGWNNPQKMKVSRGFPGVFLVFVAMITWELQGKTLVSLLKESACLEKICIYIYIYIGTRTIFEGNCGWLGWFKVGGNKGRKGCCPGCT